MLYILRTYSHNSVANQLCVLVLDNLKSMFDVVDMVSL
jgi:hypothetical protein